MAATPQKSEALVTTIGGEHDGHLLVVVQDIEKAQKSTVEHTSIPERKLEPGHNIFEGEVVNNVKSKAPKHPPLPVDVKEISSVIMRESKTASESESTSRSSSTSSDSSTAAFSSTSTTATLVGDKPQTDRQQVKLNKPAGPLGKAEAEAEKAASELYPDAVKK
jgi:dolichyl-phosphate-mannose-protein mannosyltransferase